MSKDKSQDTASAVGKVVSGRRVVRVLEAETGETERIVTVDRKRPSAQKAAEPEAAAASGGVKVDSATAIGSKFPITFEELEPSSEKYTDVERAAGRMFAARIGNRHVVPDSAEPPANPFPQSFKIPSR